VKVRFTPRALAQAKRRKSWWLENRPAAPELFDLELSAALSTLSRNPTLGNVYEAAVGLVVRRLLMKKTASHVYYAVDGDELVVLSLWGARRGRGPKL
jgi:plasmid stabilization system protein ParE